ncbi:acetyl-CoA C-acetyltransferase [Enterococcus sp. AZ109]|uniref:acetyl-CoA C-acetyltransferase n=1 Tax=Enterococcus sp. AZ109 TaxID=2774634 RepID=UPI003F2944B1
MTKRRVAIIDARRTPIGRFNGSLSTLSSVDLGAAIISDLLNRTPSLKSQIDYVLMGSVLQAGKGQNVARQAAIQAGLAYEVPALTINNVCGSSLNAVNLGAAMILSGQAKIVISGGMESMSQAVFTIDKIRTGIKLGDGKLSDSLIHDALWDAFNDYHMGITAENLAKKYSISRQVQDEFALESQKKAVAAQKNGLFAEEICPVTIQNKKQHIMVSQDESPREDASLEKLSKLKPAFLNDGTVTAGNASSINDGAAAIILVAEELVDQLEVEPLGYYVDSETAGVDPAIMGIGPFNSSKKLLKRNSLTADMIDVIEANEAFAAQYLAVEQELDLLRDKVNVNGGAIALGHPVGASGARILTTLLYEMKRNNKERGLATLCVGGGMGVSTLVERI